MELQKEEKGKGKSEEKGEKERSGFPFRIV